MGSREAGLLVSGASSSGASISPVGCCGLYQCVGRISLANPGFGARPKGRASRAAGIRRGLGSRYPTLRQKEGEGWGTRFLGWVKGAKSKSRSPFDSDRCRDLRSGQALGSAEERFARDDTAWGGGSARARKVRAPGRAGTGRAGILARRSIYGAIPLAPFPHIGVT